MIVIIGCGKSKQDKSCEAEKMYTGKYFKTCLEYAKTFNSPVYILSAEYGLLRLNDKIQPYDKTLNTMSKKESLEWANKVKHQILNNNIPLDKVVFLCGKNYHQHLSSLFSECVYPLRDLKGMGYQISYMLQQLKHQKFSVKKLF